MPKQARPKKPSRKFVLIDVETNMSNAPLADLVREELHAIHLDWGGDVHVLQVHVNAAKRKGAES